MLPPIRQSYPLSSILASHPFRDLYNRKMGVSEEDIQELNRRPLPSNGESNVGKEEKDKEPMKKGKDKEAAKTIIPCLGELSL